MKCQIREYGSEYDWLANEDYLLPLGQYQPFFEQAQKFRSGRDALKAVAAAYKGSYTQVLLPALCCESMVSPFTMHGILPVFYQLKVDYTADIADVRRKVTQDTILLYGSYFGIDPFGGDELLQLQTEYPGVLFLEDRTQDVLWQGERSFDPDVTVASIRKWTAIGDGGLLWSKHGRVFSGSKETEFSRMRQEAMQLKSQYLVEGIPEMKDTYRELLGTAAEMLDASADAFVMTEESKQLLEKLDIARIYAKRQINARTLQEELEGSEKLKFITQAPEKSTLYFPVLVNDQYQVQTDLAQKGVYCPVIWPIPQEALGVCRVSEHAAAHILAVPCDHRYGPEDMRYIAQQIMRVVNEK